jgi:hypothetical protein
MEEDETTFLAFVNSQIAEMGEAVRLGTDKEISFSELESALRKYSSVYISLLSLYNVARIDFQQETESFNTWYSSEFIVIRGQVNKPELSAQKWASYKEIEHMVRASNSHKYSAKKQAILEKEARVDFLGNLIDMWKSHQFILSTLSSNIRAEAGMSQ